MSADWRLEQKRALTLVASGVGIVPRKMDNEEEREEYNDDKEDATG